jgi:Zn-dependent protease
MIQVTMKKFDIPFRVHSTGWLLLLLCISLGVVLFGPRLGLIFGLCMVSSLLLHEGGHILAAIFLGVPVREFGLHIAGAYIRRARAATLQDEVLIAVSGPLMNFCLMLPLSFIPVLGPKLALCNLALGIVNLLPIPASDGMRIFRALRISTVAPSD